MSEDRFAKLKKILAEAIELASDRRQEFVQDACAGDATCVDVAVADTPVLPDRSGPAAFGRCYTRSAPRCTS